MSGPSEGRLVDHGELARANRIANAIDDIAIPHEILAEHGDNDRHLLLVGREGDGRILALVFLGCANGSPLAGEVDASWMALDTETWEAWEPVPIDAGALHVLLASTAVDGPVTLRPADGRSGRP